MAGPQARLDHLRQGLFTAATPALTSVAALQARHDQLAATHAALLRELADPRAAAAYALAQAEEATRETYLTTSRAALEAERERLRAQLEKLRQPADCPDLRPRFATSGYSPHLPVKEKFTPSGSALF